MNFFYFFVVLYFFALPTLQAQIDNKANVALLEGAYYYVDSSKNMLFESVTKQKFQHILDKKNYGFVPYRFWIKLTFKKNTYNKNFLLEIAKCDTLFFWQKNVQGVWKNTLTGNNLPFHTRPLAHHHFLFELFLPTDAPSEVYLCYRNEVQMRPLITLWEASLFYETNSKYNIFYGFFYGIIFLMTVYNIFNWWVIRDKAYLYYVGFVCFMLLVLSRHSYQYFWGNIPFFNRSGVYWWVGGAIVCMANFGRLFLQTAHYTPRMDKMLRYASYYGLVIILATFFFSFTTISRITFVTNTIYVIFLATVSLLVWRKGNPHALYLVWAWLIYAIGVIVLVLYNRNVIGESFWTSHGLQICTLLDIVILSLAMSNRYKLMNQEAQQTKLRLQALTYEHQLKEKENELLQEKMHKEQTTHQESLASKERELASMAIQVLEKTKLMHDIQKQLQTLGENEENVKDNVKNLGKKLRQSIDFNEDWENFKMHFEQVHPHFFDRLTATFPKLTNNDLKTIAYIRINLAPKDIARLLNIDAKSIKMLKYRLKKKLRLAEEIDLEFFAKTF